MHEPLRDKTRLGETVAVNRGMIVKVFETPEDAIEWLNYPLDSQLGRIHP